MIRYEVYDNRCVVFFPQYDDTLDSSPFLVNVKYTNAHKEVAITERTAEVFPGSSVDAPELTCM